MENKKLRVITISAMCVVLAVLLTVLCYNHFTNYKPSLEQKSDMSNVYVPDNTKKKGSKVLLSEIKDMKFQVYSAGDYVIVSYNGQEFEYEDWSKNIGKERPDLYYDDFNGDDQKEFVIKALKEIDEKTKEHVYCLYVLSPVKKDGKDDFSVQLVDRSEWYTTFTNAINIEMSQPAGAQNRVQFAMNTSNEKISYDSKTGLITEGHGWFARALSDSTGKYYTFKGWEKGPGMFVVDEQKKEINIEINIYASYNEVSEKQKVGAIVCGVVANGNGQVSIRSKSLFFRPNPGYVVTNPTVVGEKPWSATVKNTASGAGRSDKMIDNLNISCDFSRVNTSTSAAFNNKYDNSVSVDKIVADNNTIKVYAKSGFTFAKSKITSRNYSAEIKLNGEDCDVAFNATVENENGVSVLVFHLDKSYDSTELQKVVIKLGV